MPMTFKLGSSYTLPVRRSADRLTVSLPDGNTYQLKIPDSLLDYDFGDRCALLYGPDREGRWCIDKRAIFRKIYKDGHTYEFKTAYGDIKHAKVMGDFGFILSIPNVNNGITICEGVYSFVVRHNDSGVGIRLTCIGRTDTPAEPSAEASSSPAPAVDRPQAECRKGLVYDLAGADREGMIAAVTATARKWMLMSQELPADKYYIDDCAMIAECSQMLRMLAELSPVSGIGLIAKAKELLSYCRLGRAPFGESDIHGLNPAVFGECLRKADFVAVHDCPVMIDSKAVIIMNGSHYSFYPCNLEYYDRSYPFFIPLCNIEKDEISLYSHKDDRLDIGSVYNEDDFIESMTVLRGRVLSSPPSPEPKLEEYKAGNEFFCRISSVNTREGYIVAESTDRRYVPLSGDIRLDDFYYFKDSNISKALSEGDIIKVTLEDPGDGSGMHLSVIHCLSAFIASGVKPGERIKAMLYYKGEKQYSWITREGYVIYTPAADIYLNAIAMLTVTRVSSNGYITGSFSPENISSGYFDPYKAFRGQLTRFTEYCAASSATESEIIVDAGRILPEIMMTAVKLVSLQENIRQRFELYAVIYLLSAMTGNEAAGRYALFKMRYISNLRKFSMNRIADMRPTGSCGCDSAEIAEDLSIEGLICSYGKPENDSEIERIAAGVQPGSNIAGIAALVRAYNLSKDIMNRSILDAFRKKILALLSLSDSSEKDAICIDENDKDFIGYESSTMEFKTSIVFEAGKQDVADFNRQARVILKTIFSFMNTSGGTLYLGVNDIGYVTGVDSDIRYLGLTGIDSYCRYILDQLSLIAGRDIITSHVSVDPDRDGQIVRISVIPSARLLAFEGKYYRRVGPESRTMSENSVLIELDRRGQ